MAKRRRSIPVPEPVERALDAALDKALAIQRPVVQSYLARTHDRRPDASPAEVVEQLERRYRAAVVGIGAASGGAAALPGVGTAASVATGAAEIAAFVGATAMYVLALAELHGIPVSDPEVRRALVLAALVGEAGTIAIDGTAVEAGSTWAQVLGRRATKESLGGLNGRLGKLLLTRFGARQGALLVGRAVPFGIGAGIGAAGNAALARGVIRAARRTFGPPPKRFRGRVIDVPVRKDPAR
jgi:hypothetical protein